MPNKRITANRRTDGQSPNIRHFFKKPKEHHKVQPTLQPQVHCISDCFCSNLMLSTKLKTSSVPNILYLLEEGFLPLNKLSSIHRSGQFRSVPYKKNHKRREKFLFLLLFSSLNLYFETLYRDSCQTRIMQQFSVLFLDPFCYKGHSFLVLLGMITMRSQCRFFSIFFQFAKSSSPFI